MEVLAWLSPKQTSRDLTQVSHGRRPGDVPEFQEEPNVNDHTDSLASQDRMRNRYLNLLEASLTGTLYGDAPIDPWTGGKYDANNRALGRDWPGLAQTMIGSARMRNLRN